MMSPKLLKNKSLFFVDGYKRGYCEVKMKSPFLEGTTSDELFKRGWRLGRMDAHKDQVEPLELMAPKGETHGA